MNFFIEKPTSERPKQTKGDKTLTYYVTNFGVMCFHHNCWFLPGMSVPHIPQPDYYYVYADDKVKQLIIDELKSILNDISHPNSWQMVQDRIKKLEE